MQETNTDNNHHRDDISLELKFFLVYEIMQELEFRLVKAARNQLLQYIPVPAAIPGAELSITFTEGRIRFHSTGISHDQLVAYSDRIINALNEKTKQYTPEQLEPGLQQMNATLFASGDEFVADSGSGNRWRNMLSGFWPSPGNYVSPVIIGLNVLVFLVMVISGASIISPDPQTLVNWGANFRPYTLDGQWWRLLTCNYIHIGIIHLAFNMYALLYIGRILEPILGKSKLILAYTVTGIFGSLASLYWNNNVVSAGASGAIFGVHGVFLALLTTNFLDKSIRKEFFSNMVIFVALNLVIGMSAGFDNAGHVGGLLSGLLVGYLLLPSVRKPGNKKLAWIMMIIASLLTLGSVIGLCTTLSNDIATYEKRITEFDKIQQEAMIYDALSKALQRDSALYYINVKGIQGWKKGITLMEELERLDLPEQVHARNAKLKRYCELRIKNLELLRDAYTDTTGYSIQIKQNEEEITSLLNELNKE